MNPKHNCNAITTRSGETVEPTLKTCLKVDKLVEIEDEIEDGVAEHPSIDGHQPCRSTRGTIKSGKSKIEHPSIDGTPPRRSTGDEIEPRSSEIDRDEKDGLEVKPASIDTPNSVDRRPSVSSKTSSSADSRVYKPKIPFPRLPNKSIPVAIKSDKAQEVKEKQVQPSLRKLSKILDPRQFVFPCSIKGVELKNSLCDTGANVNVMSQAVAKKIGILDLQPSRISIELADASSAASKGFIPDLMLQIGDCLVPADFHIMDNDKPLILGASFLATVGAILDFPNKRISFSKINKKVFYPAILVGETSCMTVNDEGKHILDPGDDTTKVMDVPKMTPSTANHGVNMAVPKVRHKKTSKAFSKFRIIVPLELRERGEEVIQEMVQNTMKLFPGVVPWKVQGGMLASLDKGGGVPLKDPP